MAIKADVEKAKKKAAEEAARAASFGTFGTLKWWKAKKGKNRIRVMPPWTAEGNNAYQWWREIWVHWNIGPDEDNQQSVACPKKTPPGDQTCPICDEVERLRKSGDPADLELAKNMKAKMRIYANIIDLKDASWTEEDVEELAAAGTDSNNVPEVGDPKIQVYSFGSTIFKDLLDYYTDVIDITDLDEGHNVLLTREGDGLNTDYRVRIEQEASKAPVPDDEPKLHNLDNIMQVKSEAELLAIMEGVDPEEVKKLAASQSKKKDQTKKLTAAKKAQEESEEEEVAEEEEAAETEEAEEEAAEEEEAEEPKKPAAKAPPGKKAPPKKEEAEEDWPPLDDDGYLDFDKLTDEQIEDKQNIAVQDSNGTAVYVQCFGTARQRDADDPNCSDQCPLFKRCGERIEALDAAAAAAKPKRGPGRPPGPGKAPGKPAAASKPAPGKKPKEEEGEVDELESQMRNAIKGRK